MNGKDLEKALLWEAPHIGEKAPEQIPEAQDFCEGYKTFLNEGKTERECVKKAVTLLENAGYQMKRIAVELNGDILPKYEYSDTMLKDGDRLEVVTFVGGG